MMNRILAMNNRMLLAAVALGFGMTLAIPPAQAGAGHDHGEAPAASTGTPVPGVTAVSESFELVGRLLHDELSILVDRHASNEPVLDASLTVEVAGRSAVAAFHADNGDYSLTDAAILGQLRQAGSKPLTFTLIAGEESDLLSGELDVHDEADNAASQHGHGWQEYALWSAAGVAGLAILVALGRRLRNARHAGGAA